MEMKVTDLQFVLRERWVKRFVQGNIFQGISRGGVGAISL